MCFLGSAVVKMKRALISYDDLSKVIDRDGFRALQGRSASAMYDRGRQTFAVAYYMPAY